MNYNIINKNINELLNQGIGINIPFNNTTGLNTTYNTKDAIRSNLLNFLLTNRRERIFNPNIGSDIRNQLFENINKDNIDNISGLIIDSINDYFPNIRINKLDITPENNSLFIYISYNIINTNIQDSLQISLNNDN
jgi:phage baseplate assembly protein W